MKSVALLLSADSFEKFFGGFFGLTPDDYVTSYRNDFAWYYARSLGALGHRVSIYVLSRELDRVAATPDGPSVRFLKLPRWWRFTDPILSRLARRGILRRLRSRVEAAAFRRSLHDGLRQDAIDVLYVQEIWPDRIDFLRPPAPVELVGADHGAPARPPTDAKRATLRRIGKFVVQDEEQRRWIVEAGGNAVVIPNGVDARFFVPPDRPEKRRKSILAVGRLVDDQKRISDLIAALRDLPGFHLDIVGSGPDEESLRGIAGRLGLADRVTFHGFVSDRERLRAFYGECGVFCCPSAWEATLLVLLEAMACGTACVSSDIPTLRELLGSGGGLTVAVGDVPALTRAIADAYKRRVEFGAKARARVLAGHDQDALMRRLSDYIEAEPPMPKGPPEPARC